MDLLSKAVKFDIAIAADQHHHPVPSLECVELHLHSAIHIYDVMRN